MKILLMRNRPWHLWFAWFPVDTIDGYVVWLSYVYREQHGRGYSYRVSVK